MCNSQMPFRCSGIIPVNAFSGSTEPTLSVTTLNVLRKRLTEAWCLFTWNLSPLQSVTSFISFIFRHFIAQTSASLDWICFLGSESAPALCVSSFPPASLLSWVEWVWGCCLDWGQCRKPKVSCGVAVCCSQVKFSFHERKYKMYVISFDCWKCHRVYSHFINCAHCNIPFGLNGGELCSLIKLVNVSGSLDGFTNAIVLISVPAVQQLIDLRADLLLPNKL